MMELSNYYHTPYREVRQHNTGLLSQMYSGMLANKAKDRLHRIEELACIHMKDKDRDKFVNTIYKQVDDSYTKERAVDENELKRILGNVGYKPSN